MELEPPARRLHNDGSLVEVRDRKRERKRGEGEGRERSSAPLLQH